MNESQLTENPLEKAPFLFQLDLFNSLNDILEDLTARFILNIPIEELKSIESTCLFLKFDCV